MAVVGKPTKIGKYDVVEILGEGGMGAVYKAVDPRIGRTVAIKVIKGDFAHDPELLRRFDTEARAVGNLQHPNIVTVFDFGEENGSPFLVMQYLDGTPLDKVIAQRQNLSIIQKLDIIIGVLNALGYAHEHGVIHRDVKPANVHLLKDGSVKLLDFGIARRENLGQTKSGQVMGTMSYMPPEQLNGEVADRRGDIFSTGIVLFELLTYSQPFEARDLAAVVVQRLKGDPPPPLSKYFENYPLELDEIIARAMMRDPNDRYATAEDFAFDLIRIQERLKREMGVHLVDQARALIATSDLAKAKELLSQVLKIDAQNSAAKQLLYEVQQSLQIEQRLEKAHPIRTPAEDALAAKQLDQAADLVQQTTKEDENHPNLFERLEETHQFTRVVEPPSTTILKADAAAGNSPPPERLDSFTQIFYPQSPGSPQILAQFPPTLTFVKSVDPLLVGRTIHVTPVPFRIGRANSDLNLTSDPGISRAHAVIQQDGGAFILTDLHSANGTYLHGRPIRAGVPETLHFGDVVRFGSSTAMTFSSEQFTEMPDLTGQVVGNRFQLSRVIHNGSKSALYEARDGRLPRTVAVKILSPYLAGYPGYLEYLAREAETPARLQHPRICNVFDYGETHIRVGAGPLSATHYLAMQLMEGESLSRHLSRETLLTLDRIVACLDDVTDALDHVHRMGIVHNGIKISSIVFDQEGKAYVTDFGMASRQNDTGKHVSLGSPDFRSPEQWKGLEPTPQVDQYSLAVLTYMLVTGTRPFEGQTDENVREKNFLRGPISAHEEAFRMGRGGVPPPVSDVLNRAMLVAPEARYPSIRDFFFAFKYAVEQPKGRRKNPRVFISYRRGQSSSGWANYFETQLKRKHRISVFVDTQNVDTAVKVPAKIRKAIEECDVFVCLLAAGTLKSEWVQTEIRLASEKGKLMVPIFQKGFRTPSDSQLDGQPHIKTLVEYEGLTLSEDSHAEYTVRQLARMVKDSFKKLGGK